MEIYKVGKTTFIVVKDDNSYLSFDTEARMFLKSKTDFDGPRMTHDLADRFGIIPYENNKVKLSIDKRRIVKFFFT